MKILTSVEIKGKLGDTEKSFHFVNNAGLEAIFQGTNPRELFLRSVSNPGCFDLQESDIRLNIHVQRNCSFGTAGFLFEDVETDHFQEAIDKYREFEGKSDRQLFVEALEALPDLPDPEALEKIAVDFLCEGNKELAFATADFVEKVIKGIVGEKDGVMSGMKFLIAVGEKAAVRMAGKNKKWN